MSARAVVAVAAFLFSCARGSGSASQDSAADPCHGVACTTPPANACADPDQLIVYEDTGACEDGACTYASSMMPCPFGCEADVCDGDPCIGVSCNTPPAKHCVDANNLRVYDAPGTCLTGTCSYPNHDELCTYGCVNGACLECQTTSNCPSGEWCNGGSCATCNTHQHCGASCTNCSATGDYCNAGSTGCVDCLVDNHCGAGNYCNATSCATCNVAAHCGPSCVACSGQTPMCSGSSCVCTATSCGAYNKCVGGGCVECNTAASCGANCTACGGATPFCLDEGATSKCVECLSNADCTGGKSCSQGSCVFGCPAPASACQSGGNQDGACSGSYTITRAAAAAGFHVDDTYGLCGRNSDFPNVAGCESGASNGSDASYRLYMKIGETAHITLTRGSSTCSVGWNGTISLKVYGTACSADCATCSQTCGTVHHCAQNNNQNINFTAPASGWYAIVVDSRGADTDDIGGVFDLTVQLTCPGGCTCP